jgi:hypothetical protein
MLAELNIHRRGATSLMSFLEANDFVCEPITEHVFKITRDDELPVFVHSNGDNLYFEVDLGSTKQLSGSGLYEKLLDLNTEILPVSVGINSSNQENPSLVLVESRESSNLDENEFLSVINALELATDKVASVIAEHI